MIFTKKIFDNKIDKDVHSQFTRFSKGTFESRSVIKITIVKDKLKLNASYDLVKDITMAIAENFDKIEAIGKVIHEKKKEEIDKILSGEELKKICEENTFILLNLTFEDYSIKVGKSIPKPGKGLKNNFCKCILPINLLKGFTDNEGFKKAEISHTFIIEDIVIPKEYKNDFALARLNSKRKGKIIRIEIIDKKENIKEIDFEV